MGEAVKTVEDGLDLRGGNQGTWRTKADVTPQLHRRVRDRKADKLQGVLGTRQRRDGVGLSCSKRAKVNTRAQADGGDLRKIWGQLSAIQNSGFDEGSREVSGVEGIRRPGEVSATTLEAPER